MRRLSLRALLLGAILASSPALVSADTIIGGFIGGPDWAATYKSESQTFTVPAGETTIHSYSIRVANYTDTINSVQLSLYAFDPGTRTRGALLDQGSYYVPNTSSLIVTSTPDLAVTPLQSYVIEVTWPHLGFVGAFFNDDYYPGGYAGFSSATYQDTYGDAYDLDFQVDFRSAAAPVPLPAAATAALPLLSLLALKRRRPA